MFPAKTMVVILNVKILSMMATGKHNSAYRVTLQTEIYRISRSHKVILQFSLVLPEIITVDAFICYLLK